MLYSYEGTIQTGMGAATGKLKRQIPMIAQKFPEIVGCYCGTINIKLDNLHSLLHRRTL